MCRTRVVFRPHLNDSLQCNSLQVLPQFIPTRRKIVSRSSSEPTDAVGGSLKLVMQACHLAEKDRAAFLRVVADRDDHIEMLAVELIDVLRAMAADVDAQLAHGGDSFWPHDARLGAGAFHLVGFAGIMAQRTEIPTVFVGPL